MVLQIIKRSERDSSLKNLSLTEWFFVEPKMVLLRHRLKNLLKNLFKREGWLLSFHSHFCPFFKLKINILTFRSDWERELKKWKNITSKLEKYFAHWVAHWKEQPKIFDLPSVWKDCWKTFITAYKLKLRQSFHTVMRFRWSGHLKMHKRIHTGENHTTWSVKRSFTHANTLKLQLCSHSGEKTFNWSMRQTIS